MNLADLLIDGPRAKPPLVCLYGEPGVGKSTLFRPCLTLDVEGGAEGVGGLRVPRARLRSWTDLLAALEAVRSSPAPHVAIDTIDAAAELAASHVMERAGVDSLNAGELSYGKGTDQLAGELRRLLRACELLERPVYLVAHSIVKRWEDPILGAYDRYVPNLSPKLWDLVWRQCDAVLFARFAAGVRRVNGKQTTVHSDRREILTTKDTGYEAKNRMNLPRSIPLEWSALQAAMRQDTPATIQERCTALILRLPEERRADATRYLASAGQEATKLYNTERRLIAALEGDHP